MSWGKPDVRVLLRRCSGIASLLIPCATLVHPLYIPCTTVVHPLYTHGYFGSTTVAPSSPSLLSKAIVWPSSELNRVFTQRGQRRWRRPLAGCARPRVMSRRFGSWIRGLCRLPKSLNRLGAYFAGLTSSLPALWADDRP